MRRSRLLWHRSAVFHPDSCSCRIAMIGSSLTIGYGAVQHGCVGLPPTARPANLALLERRGLKSAQHSDELVRADRGLPARRQRTMLLRAMEISVGNPMASLSMAEPVATRPREPYGRFVISRFFHGFEKKVTLFMTWEKGVSSRADRSRA